MGRRKTKLVSLAYSDSENENDSVEGDEEEEDSDLDGDANSQSEGRHNEALPEEYFEDVYGEKHLTILEFHESIFGKSIDEVKIPPPTRNRCSEELQLQIESFAEKVKLGYDLNAAIQKKKNIRNPSIYEKMISYCQIDEMATNYPKEIHDPEPFLQDESFYEELARKQKEGMEKETGTKRVLTLPSSGTEKKSKWDSAGSNLATAMARAQNIMATITFGNMKK